MMTIPLHEFVEACRGEIVVGRDLDISDFATRWTRIRPGTLFFDLRRGQRIPAPGAHFPFAVLTEQPARFSGATGGAAIIRVQDIREAYWACVAYYRSLLHIRMVGVTGTCGKTTTKEMIRHIFAKKWKVNATYKSRNAQIHHLSYLLRMDETTQAAVIEMGVASPGDLTVACRYFKPQVGVITNIGIDHLNTFGSLEAYIRGKAEFLPSLPDNGTFVANADDENIRRMDFSAFRGNVLWYGQDEGAAFRILSYRQLDGGLAFRLLRDDHEYEFFVPGQGEFLVWNAAAAIAAATVFGISVKEAGEALLDFRNVERHFERKRGLGGGVLIDDTWSSNPTSATRALEMLQKIAAGRKTIAVLGMMSLLGSFSDDYHFTVGQNAAKTGVSELIVLGEEARAVGRGAIDGGMPRENVHFCRTTEEAVRLLREHMGKDTVTLVKTTMLASYASLTDRITEK